MELTDRQETILNIVKEHGPITGENIAIQLSLTRATVRPDLAFLTMSGYLEAKPRVGYTYRPEGVENRVKKILNQYRVKDIQSLPVVVKETSSIYDAIVALFIEDTGSVFIVGEDNYLTGVVSRKDFLKTTMGNVDIHKVPVSVIMTRMPNVVTTTAEEMVVEAVRKVVEHEVDSLPVVKCFIDKEGEEKLKVVGRITKTTLVRLFLDLACTKN
ncbi:MAG TPA: helix-turn-helix transcriptional regulator [Syntrophomonadaceae bacterium]|nr:helix-turn-helix transcriptional regulator [Syntrophomonadaceae bacterium]